MKLGAARSQGTGGLAPGRRSRSLPDSATFSYRARSQQAAPGAPARRPLSAAHQSHRATIRPSCGSSTCNSSRSRKPSRTSRAISPSGPIFHQARSAHRGAHLRRLPGLLPARHARAPAARPGARPHPAQRAREVRRHADDRRARPDHRRPRTCCSPATPSRSRSCSCCSTSSSSSCQPSRHRKSPPARARPQRPLRSADLSGRDTAISTA